MILDFSHRLRRKIKDPTGWIALSSFLIVAAALCWIAAIFLSLAVVRLPEILNAVLPAIQNMATQFRVDLPFENLQELRALISEAISVNAAKITMTSGLLTKGFFRIVIGIVAAVMYFLSLAAKPKESAGLAGRLRAEFGERVRRFLEALARDRRARPSRSTLS